MVAYQHLPSLHHVRHIPLPPSFITMQHVWDCPFQGNGRLKNGVRAVNGSVSIPKVGRHGSPAILILQAVAGPEELRRFSEQAPHPSRHTQDREPDLLYTVLLLALHADLHKINFHIERDALFAQKLRKISADIGFGVTSLCNLEQGIHNMSLETELRIASTLQKHLYKYIYIYIYIYMRVMYKCNSYMYICMPYALPMPTSFRYSGPIVNSEKHLFLRTLQIICATLQVRAAESAWCHTTSEGMVQKSTLTILPCVARLLPSSSRA